MLAGVCFGLTPLAPYGVLATLMTRGQPPHWKPAAPKRFAWCLGVILLSACLVVGALQLRWVAFALAVACVMLTGMEAAFGENHIETVRCLCLYSSANCLSCNLFIGSAGLHRMPEHDANLMAWPSRQHRQRFPAGFCLGCWMYNLVAKILGRSECQECRAPAGPIEGLPDAIMEAAISHLTTTHSHLIFSKSTCSHCKRAMRHLQSLGKDYHVVELDKPEGQALVPSLQRITKQYTVPYIFVQGKFVGGASDLIATMV